MQAPATCVWQNPLKTSLGSWNGSKNRLKSIAYLQAPPWEIQKKKSKKAYKSGSQDKNKTLHKNGNRKTKQSQAERNRNCATFEEVEMLFKY